MGMQPAYLVPVPSQDKLGGLLQEGHPMEKWKNEGGGSLISTDGVATSQIVSVSASDVFPCAIKSRRRFLLAPAHLGSSGKGAVKWLFVCVCILITVANTRL